MKKLLLLLCMALFGTILMSGSCSRVCTCGYYAGLFLINEEYEESIAIGEKCSDLNTWDDESKLGVKCR